MWNWAENQIRLVFIRHGATKANKEHRYLGKTDETLSEEGNEELITEKYSNIYPDIDYLFSSPMRRCLETAKILYPDREINIISDWEEMNFGVFEGKNYVDLQGDVRYQEWIDSNGTLPFPNGESREDFTERCKQGFYKMLSQLNSLHLINRTVKVGLVIHGGTIMSLLSTFGGGDYFDYQVSNCQGYICTLNEIQGYPRMVDVQKIGAEK